MQFRPLPVYNVFSSPTTLRRSDEDPLQSMLSKTVATSGFGLPSHLPRYSLKAYTTATEGFCLATNIDCNENTPQHPLLEWDFTPAAWILPLSPTSPCSKTRRRWTPYLPRSWQCWFSCWTASPATRFPKKKWCLLRSAWKCLCWVIPQRIHRTLLPPPKELAMRFILQTVHDSHEVIQHS